MLFCSWEICCDDRGACTFVEVAILDGAANAVKEDADDDVEDDVSIDANASTTSKNPVQEEIEMTNNRPNT